MYNIKNSIGASVNGKAVTLVSKGSVEELVLLGSSCPASVSLEDGGVQSFVILPETDNEVIAVAIMRGYDRLVQYVYLLKAKKDGEKYAVELDQAFACSEQAVGQLIIKDNTVLMRVTTPQGYKFVAPAWDPKSVKVEEPAVKDRIPTNTFSDLCRFIVGKSLDKVRVLLLTTAFTPDAEVYAESLIPVWNPAGGEPTILISVCKGQGCAYEGESLYAHWKANQWQVSHPAC